MSQLSQNRFSGGIDLLSPDTEIAEDAYRYAFNIRARYGSAETIFKSTNITYNLQGKLQGVYAIGAITIAFFSGRAYFKTVTQVVWSLVPNFSMDPFVDYIYAQAVTGSTNNFLRKAVVDGSGLVDARAGVINNPFSFNGTPAGVVCQDGINQPWFITYDSVNNNATARRLGTYTTWTKDNNPEYVPIGTKMMYLDGVLYIVNNNVWCRSVSGSPLNFMINIDSNGDKLATEALGGALTTSGAQDYDTINAILPIGTGQFIIATSRFIYGELADFSRPTIFGEPQFTKIFQVEAGAVNQFSFSDKNGDAAFIDFEGVKFFNSTKVLKFEGINDPLSKNISRVLKDISQNICATISFDNYNLFGLKTTFGYAIAIYDNLIDKWVSLDITDASVGGIKMFAELVIPNARYLVAGNDNNEVWLMYSDLENRETGTMRMRSFVSGSYSQMGNFVPDGIDTEHKTNFIKVGIECGQTEGTITCVEYVDDKRGQYQTKDIDGVIQGFTYPIFPPVLPANTQANNGILFPFNKGLRGYKITPLLRWSSDCKINKVELDTSSETKPMSQQQQKKVIANP